MGPSIWSDSLTSHKQRQRQHIVQAAARLIADRGAGDLTMSALARRASVSRATLYHYFPDVEGVIAAVVTEQAARFRSDLDRKLSGAVNSHERLTCYVLTVHQWAQRRARHPRGKRKLSSQMLAVVHEPLAELRELLAAILADGIANGTFASELDPALHAQLILNMITDPHVSTPTAPQQLIGFIQRGLSPQNLSQECAAT
jgi:AcrR family transcriptional regulator